MQPSPFARIKKPLKSDMNVVPYIDVMLVLLVIFMVTAPMITAGLTVDLPKAPSDAIAVSQQQPAIVSVKSDGALFLRLADSSDKAITIDALTQQLLGAQQLLNQKQQTLTVLVNGDSHVAYGEIVKLMAGLQKAGLRQVGLLTETPEPNAVSMPNATSTTNTAPSTTPATTSSAQEVVPEVVTE